MNYMVKIVTQARKTGLVQFSRPAVRSDTYINRSDYYEKCPHEKSDTELE